MSRQCKNIVNNFSITYRYISSKFIAEQQNIIIFSDGEKDLKDFEMKELKTEEIKNSFKNSFLQFEKQGIAFPKIEFSYITHENQRKKVDYGPLLVGEIKKFTLFKKFTNYMDSHFYNVKIHFENEIITPHFPIVVNTKKEIDEFSNSVIFSQDDDFHRFKLNENHNDPKDYFLHNVSNLIENNPDCFSKQEIKYYINLCRRI